jgi:hypothetical protein
MEHEEIALNVARRQGVRATLVIGGEVSNRPEIDPLGGWDEPPDGHVFDHTLLEWGHGVLLACGINIERPGSLVNDQPLLGTPCLKGE